MSNAAYWRTVALVLTCGAALSLPWLAIAFAVWLVVR